MTTAEHLEEQKADFVSHLSREEIDFNYIIEHLFVEQGSVYFKEMVPYEYVYRWILNIPVIKKAIQDWLGLSKELKILELTNLEIDGKTWFVENYRFTYDKSESKAVINKDWADMQFYLYSVSYNKSFPNKVELRGFFI